MAILIFFHLKYRQSFLCKENKTQRNNSLEINLCETGEELNELLQKESIYKYWIW